MGDGEEKVIDDVMQRLLELCECEELESVLWTQWRKQE